jgi:hypothetical protein
MKVLLVEEGDTVSVFADTHINRERLVRSFVDQTNEPTTAEYNAAMSDLDVHCRTSFEIDDDITTILVMRVIETAE